MQIPLPPHSCVFCAVVALLGATTSVARAETGGTSASELFQQGREAMKRSDYAAACHKFEESERLAPAPGTLLNIAACSEKLGRLANALDALRKANELLPAADSRAAYVTEQIVKLEPRVPHLTLRLPERSSQARVTIDHEELPLEKAAHPIPLNPGEHVVALFVPGHEVDRQTVTLDESQAVTLALRPGPAIQTRAGSRGAPVGPATGATDNRAHDAHADEARSSDDSTRRTAAYVALGVGGLGLVVGAVTGILVLDKKATMESHCDGSLACDSTGLDAASAGQTLSTISTASFVLAAAGAGVGAYLLLSDDSDEAARTAVGLIPGVSGADMTLLHRF